MSADAGLGAVVVHYRSEQTLPDTVADLAARVPPERLVVVDNSGSLDATALSARVVVPERNVGYGAAVNLGVRHLPDAVTTVLIATHEVRLRPEDVDAMAHTLAESGIGQVGPVLVDAADPLRSIWSAGGTCSRWIAWPGHRKTVDSAAAIQWIDGACFLVERALFDALGGMPEEFFVYMEDIAFSMAVRRAGLEVTVCPSARVEQSAKGPDLGLAVRNRWLLLLGHFPARIAVLGVVHLHLVALAHALLPTARHRAKARCYRLALREARAVRRTPSRAQVVSPLAPQGGARG